jgi:predicted permease
MSKLFILLSFLIVGLGLQKFLTTHYTTKLSNFLNKFVIYVSLPAMVLIYLRDIKFNNSFFIPIITAWGVFAFVVALVVVFAKIYNFKKETIVAIIMLLAFSNSSFMGFPFTLAFFGSKGLPYAIMYDQLGSFLILSIFGVIILSFVSTKRVSIVSLVKKVITFPSFIALLFAYIFSDINYPFAIEAILKVLASILAPAALISIGLNLHLKIPRDEIAPMTLILSLKLIILPIIVMLLFRVFGTLDIAKEVSIFEVAMAPMVTSSMLAIMAGIKPRFIATTLGFGIVLSFVTLPLIYAIIS